jgi:hypothetical protein
MFRVQVMVEKDSVVGVRAQKFLCLGDVFRNVKKVPFEASGEPSVAAHIVFQKKDTNRMTFHLHGRQTDFAEK